MRGATPTFSIAIEWENARDMGLDRARRMLRRLDAELAALAPPASPPEVIFLCDRASIDQALVSRLIEQDLRPAETPADVRIVPTDRLGYYEQKNLGGALACGDILIFLDCDVVPEPGWLAALLSSFDDPAVGVVGGDTYVELSNLSSKAFALFFCFDLRAKDERLAPAAHFFANNVAFRREIFAAHRFPDMTSYRGQCTILGETLSALNLGLFRQPRAHAMHPAMPDLGYFVLKALRDGRDAVVVQQFRAGGGKVGMGRVLGSYRERLGYAARQIRAHRDDVSLSPVGGVAALSVAFAFFTLRAIGMGWAAAMSGRARSPPRVDASWKRAAAE